VPTPIKQASDVAPGDFYEDCAFHPCLCIRVDGDEVNGISLVDGSYPRGCSIFGCAIRKLTFEEALQWKFRGPPDVEFAEDARWWPVERLLGYEFLRGRSDVLRDAPGSQGQ
jgi:hypothetical protein